MGMFDSLFQESAVEETKDYFEGLPIPTFDMNESLVTCGMRGMVLAETGWLNISASINNDLFVESLEEADETAGTEEKSEKKVNKIVAILMKIKELIMTAARAVFAVINTFLNVIKNKAKEVASKIGKVDERKILAAFNASKKQYTFTGFVFTDKDKGVERIRKAMKKAQTSAGTFGLNPDTNSEKSLETFKPMILRDLTGKESIDNMADEVAATYGKKYDKATVNEDIMKEAISNVNGGFVSGTMAARKAYKGAKELFNDYVKKCDTMAKELKANAKKGEDLSEKAKSVENTGKAMTAMAGILNKFTGIYCQLLRSSYFSSIGLVLKFIGKTPKETKDEIKKENKEAKEAAKEAKKAAKEEKNAKEEAAKEEKTETTTESAASIFGLDMI